MGVGMGLDRDELAVKCYLALITPFEGCAPVEDFDYATLARTATSAADALLSRLAPAPAPSLADAERRDAPKCAAPDPRRTVGAVVRWDGQQDPDEEWLLVGNRKAVALKVRRPHLLDCGTNLDGGGDYFVRWATREECEKHGIPYVERGPTPSPAASPAAYVPKCGDVVTIFGVTGLASPDWIGSVATVVHASFGGENVNLRIDYSPAVSWIQRYIDEGRSADTRELTPVGFHLRPATAAERVAAGLDAPAVDREGLADAIRRSRAGGASMNEWSRLDVYDRTLFLNYADAAIAFLKANGGAK